MLCFQGSFSQFHLEQAGPRDRREDLKWLKWSWTFFSYQKVDFLIEEEKIKNNNQKVLLLLLAFLCMPGDVHMYGFLVVIFLRAQLLFEVHIWPLQQNRHTVFQNAGCRCERSSCSEYLLTLGIVCHFLMLDVLLSEV